MLTDEDGATDDPHVFAGDDVWRQRSIKSPSGTRMESWQNAIEQAGRAAKAILGLETPVLIRTEVIIFKARLLRKNLADRPLSVICSDLLSGSMLAR